MSVGSTTRLISYTIDDTSTAPLAVDFRFDAESWLNVYYVPVDGESATLLILGSDYTIGGNGVEIEGTVTLTASFLASITTGQLTIARLAPALQTLDLEYNTRLPSAAVEKALDWQAMALQDRDPSPGGIGGRAIVMPVTEPPSNSNVLAIPEARKGKPWWGNPVTGKLEFAEMEDFAPAILSYYGVTITTDDVLSAISAIAPLFRKTPPDSSIEGKGGQLAIIPEYFGITVSGTLNPNATGPLLPWKADGTTVKKLWFTTTGENPQETIHEVYQLAWTNVFTLTQFIGGGPSGKAWIALNGNSGATAEGVTLWLPLGGATGSPAISVTDLVPARAWLNLSQTGEIPNWEEIGMERNRDLFYPESFGASGDGIKDDTPAIQTAIDACGANGGGTVIFGSKTYKVDESPDGGYCLKIPYNNVCLVGQGASSRIACASATATTILVAESVGPYDSATPYIDNVKIKDLYFNPLVQKEDEALEIHVPSTRHFKVIDCHYGRREGMTTGAEVAEGEESNIGTFASIGDLDTPYAAQALFQNTRGFGHYRFLQATNIADLILTGCGTDANRVASQSIRLYGGASVAATNCDFVNSAGFLDSWDACILMEEAGGRVPSFCKFTNIYFDTHKWAVYATAGFDINFTNCWTAGKNSPGIHLSGTADRFLFAGGEAADNRQEGIEVLAGNHTFRDWTVFGVAKVIGETDSRSAIHIGPDTGIITLDNVRVLGGGHGGIAATAALSSLTIAAGPKRVEIIGGEYHDGINDLSGLTNGVSQSSMTCWLRPSGVPNPIDGRLITRWPNSLLSKLIGRAPGDALRPAFRSNVDGVPCLEFGKGGRTFDCLRLHDEIAGSDTTDVLGDFTITALVKITGTCTILGTSNNNWALRISSGGVMSVKFAGAGTTVSAASPLATPMGEWVLVTWRRTGGTLEFFENGALLDTQVGASTEGMIMGQISGHNGSEPLTGYLAELVLRTVAESNPSLAALSLAIMNQYPSVFAV